VLDDAYHAVIAEARLPGIDIPCLDEPALGDQRCGEARFLEDR
jgi:hypothetical protein